MAFRLAHSQLAFQLTPALRNIVPTPYLNVKIGLMVYGGYRLFYESQEEINYATYCKKKPKFTEVTEIKSQSLSIIQVYTPKAKTCPESISSPLTFNCTSHSQNKTQY